MPSQPQAAMPPYSDTKRSLLVGGTTVAGIISLVSIIVLISTIRSWSSADLFSSVLWVIVGLLQLAAMIALTWYLYSCIPSVPALNVCQCCGKPAPTIRARLNRHIGAILLMFHKSLRAHLCRDCIAKTFWEFTLITFFFGWWGLISCVITPIVLVANLATYLRSFGMPDVIAPVVPPPLPRSVPTTTTV